MQPMYYIGLDVHKRKISYCVKDGSGRIHAEGSISATRLELDHWMRSLPQPWSAAIKRRCLRAGSTIISNHMRPC
jgi:transposase